ncbi:hypothetical protein KI387_023759, partial [Taxus chinensis]
NRLHNVHKLQFSADKVDIDIHILCKTYVYPNKEAYVETMESDNIDITPEVMDVGQIELAC